MLARWKTAVLKHRMRQPTVGACTPPSAPTKTHGHQRTDQSGSRPGKGSDREDGDDARQSISSVVSDDSDQQLSAGHSPASTDWRHQTLLQRVVGGKNRLVQRVLVKCKLADASKDVYYSTKQSEYDQAIQVLANTKEVIELYAQSLLDVSTAVRNFAGNASDVRHCDRDDTTPFLVAAEMIEDRGYQFLEQVREHVLRPIDDRVGGLHHVSELLRERTNLQIDVDYAKRTLVVAQKRGDVNVIADKKKALQVAQLRRRDATRQIAQLLRRYDSKQAQELDDIITEFASITKEFFHGGAALLRAVESPAHRSSATLRFPRRLTHPVGDRDPVAV